jgi:hypothetical protein
MRVAPFRRATRAGALSGYHRALRVHTSFDMVQTAPPQDDLGRRCDVRVNVVLASETARLEAQPTEAACT